MFHRTSARVAAFAAAIACVASAAPCAAHSVHVSQVNLAQFPSVRVYVSVVDSAQRPVAGLGIDAFEAKLDGQPVQLATVGPARTVDEPIAAMLAIDRSGSMRGSPLRHAVDAAEVFVNSMSAHDVIGLIGFDDRVTVLVPPTRDRARLIAGLTAMTVGRDTAMNDAVAEAVTALSNVGLTRKIVILLTDGKENRSKTKPDAAINLARREAVVVHTVGLGADIDRRALRRLAGETAGQMYLARTPGELVQLFRGIEGLIRSEYVLTFPSRVGLDQQWHGVTVAVTVRGTRAEGQHDYFAPRQVPAMAAAIPVSPPRGTSRALIAAAGILGAAVVTCAVIVVVYRRGRPALS